MKTKRYTLPLREPFRVGDVLLHERTGLLLGTDGRVADLCPLPGLSAETLAEAGTNPNLPASTWARFCFDHFPVSVDGLEEASALPVLSASLATADISGDTPEGATIKLKVGRRRVDEEISWVASWARRARVRLDGNRNLNLMDAVRLGEAAGASLDFFEEPTMSMKDTLSMAKRFPVALDENLAVANDELLERSVAWVLKPVVLGTKSVEYWVDKAAREDIRIIISSVFESRVGRRALAEFAYSVAPNETHGLGTGAFFASDLSGADLQEFR